MSIENLKKEVAEKDVDPKKAAIARRLSGKKIKDVKK